MPWCAETSDKISIVFCWRKSYFTIWSLIEVYYIYWSCQLSCQPYMLFPQSFNFLIFFSCCCWNMFGFCLALNTVIRRVQSWCLCQHRVPDHIIFLFWLWQVLALRGEEMEDLNHLPSLHEVWSPIDSATPRSDASQNMGVAKFYCLH